MRLSTGIGAALSLFSCSTVAQLTFFTTEPDSIFFPSLQNANTSELFPMPKCGGFTLQEATIDQMQAAMKNGILTSTQLVLCYMERAWQTQGYLKSEASGSTPAQLANVQ